MKKMKLFSLAWPIFIETALFMLLGLVDVFILSGYEDLAASSVSTANQTVSIMTIIFNIFSTASAVMISQHLGAKQRRDASQVAALSIVLQLFFGVIVSAVYLLFNRQLLILIGAEGQLLDYACRYLSIVGGSMFLQ
ncbi:MAG: MATE family efflux transporter, partial [Eubacteriales bacterium]|nr:MATE family efflux transporter [Eubacteriales bacterium]